MSDMTVISENDLIESVADALQYISYYHPMDYIRALGDAYEAEKGPAAKDAIAQILTNSRMCAEGHRPICQDTGIVNVFVKWGMSCRLDSERSLQVPTIIRTTSCARRSLPIRRLRVALLATIRHPCSRLRWSLAIRSAAMLPPRAVAARTSRSSR